MNPEKHIEDYYKYVYKLKKKLKMTTNSTTLTGTLYPNAATTYGSYNAPTLPTLPILGPKELEEYIKQVRAHNYWNELEGYKLYLRYCEKNFPDDKVWGYHQKDK